MIRLKRGHTFSSDKGSIKHEELIGKRYGDAVLLSTGIKAYILSPLYIDFLMKGFTRATQVIYPKDLGFIILLSGIGPGSRVLEAGVGTGFLTSMLAKIVGDEGHIYAYEIRKDFAKVALSNLRKLGLDSRVTLKIKDVKEGIEERDLDSAFLDLPEPWEVIPHLREALKPTSPVIVFVPTVNQVIKVMNHLKDSGNAVDLHIYELLLREYQPDVNALRPQSIIIGHTGYIIFFRILP